MTYHEIDYSIIPGNRRAFVWTVDNEDYNIYDPNGKYSTVLVFDGRSVRKIPAFEYREQWVWSALHRDDGPAVIDSDGRIIWVYKGFETNFENWCDLTKQNSEQIVELKLKFL